MLNVEGTESTGSGRQRGRGACPSFGLRSAIPASAIGVPSCLHKQPPPPDLVRLPTCSVGPTDLLRLQRLPARRAASSLGAPLSSLSARSASPIGGFPHSFLIEWPLLWVESRLLSASSSGVPRQFTSPQKSTRRREGALCPHPLPPPLLLCRPVSSFSTLAPEAEITFEFCSEVRSTLGVN